MRWCSAFLLMNVDKGATRSALFAYKIIPILASVELIRKPSANAWKKLRSFWKFDGPTLLINKGKSSRMVVYYRRMQVPVRIGYTSLNALGKLRVINRKSWIPVHSQKQFGFENMWQKFYTRSKFKHAKQLCASWIKI